MGGRSEPLHVLYVGSVLDRTASASLDASFDRAFVSTATGAEDGLDLLAESGVDCVVSGYDLPDANGVELLEAVRETRPELPFILYTDRGNETVASRAVDAGVTAYLPVDRDTDDHGMLWERIEAAVEASEKRRLDGERIRELRRYERIVNTIREAAIIYDEDGRYSFVNEYVAEWYDTTREALQGQPSRLIEAIRERADGDPYAELIEGDREELRGEVEAALGDHGPLHMEYRLTALEIDGTVEGAVGVARDVTERKERERQLAFFHQLVESAGTGIGVYDETGEFIYVNRACMELLGMDEGTLEGMNVWEINPEFDRERFEEYWNSFSPGEARSAETVLSVGDTSVPVETITTRAEIQGDTYHFGTISDRTARREYERELERRNDRLEQFASVVSHDLRNPLSIARGRLELARTEPTAEQFDEIERAHERMDTLIENLLTLAREGQTVTDPEPVDLRELVERCWATVETADATVSVDVDVTINADRGRLKRVFENLFRNSVEHGSTSNRSQTDDSVEHGSTGSRSQTGDSVEHGSTSNRSQTDDSVEHGGAGVSVTVGELDDGFYVADDGPGIPASDRTAVFETGYSTAENGTGFGLSIVRRIVEAHGWNIEVVDGTSGGVRFEITGVERRSDAPAVHSADQ